MKPVKDINIKKGDSANKIVQDFLQSGGFTSRKVADAVQILQDMLTEKDCLKFLSFPANIVATGTRGILRDMLKKKLFDIVITTCGTLDHDIARSFADYFHGSFDVDDRELHKRGVNRLGNIFIPNASYGEVIEKKMIKWLKDLEEEGKNKLSTYELCWEIGKRLKKDSILYWAWKNGIPIIVPGITDGAVGYQIWQFAQDHKFNIDLLEDEKMIADRVWTAKKSGALIIGGGISKHHVIWWNQFKNGLDYAVYITTSVEWDGSLSGARTREAISWGKINEKAKHVTVEGDATLLLPIIFAALLEKI
jgi:deoxyhypusine synthase